MSDNVRHSWKKTTLLIPKRVINEEASKHLETFDMLGTNEYQSMCPVSLKPLRVL